MLCSPTRSLSLIFGIICGFIILLASSCGNEDDGFALPEEYDPTRHIYSMNAYRNSEDAYECIINPTTGEFHRLEGTAEPFGSFDIPIGPRFLTDFENKRRIYPARLGTINIQDLVTLEVSSIDVAAEGTHTGSWDFLTFGQDNNTIIGYDIGDRRVFSFDIPTQTITVVAQDLPFPGTTVEAVEYLRRNNEVAIFTRESYLIYDIDDQVITQQDTFSLEMFGYVQHPDEEKFYALTVPSGGRGFRLIEIFRNDNQLLLQTRSQEKLDINKIATNRQTIFTAGNSYICTGGSGSIENPTNFLYSIDLSSGRLLHSHELYNFGLMLKLRGE